MSDFVIRVENLGKKYKIRHQQDHQRYVALRDVIAEKAAAPLRWLSARSAKRKAQSVSNNNGVLGSDALPLPLSSSQLGSQALRLTPDVASDDLPLPLTASQPATSPSPLPLTPLQGEEEFWALRGISFEVKQGEVLGIIGRNGAGKTTLLKILSRITEPTEGRVRIRGRVASLLEVGTGFHPELTGRENIFVNGAILGMTRAEVQKKFDEIVDFSGVEKFLDTPVKRYSSGMYVRLAFAVAAHLEPEILIVDEVLAVGDAEFQKKCLGKMSEVALGGRTVLFVSHNMASVKSITPSGIVLENGQIAFGGSTGDAIESYARSMERSGTALTRDLGAGVHTRLEQVQLLNQDKQPLSHYSPGDPFVLEITFTTDGSSLLSLEAFLLDSTRSNLGLASLYQFQGLNLPSQPGHYVCRLLLEPLWLAAGSYWLDVTTSLINHGWDHYVEEAITFDVIACNPLGFPWNFKHSYGYGALAMLCAEAPRFIPLEYS